MDYFQALGSGSLAKEIVPQGLPVLVTYEQITLLYFYFMLFYYFVVEFGWEHGTRR